MSGESRGKINNRTYCFIWPLTTSFWNSGLVLFPLWEGYFEEKQAEAAGVVFSAR